MALLPFAGPWPLLQFRNLFYTDGRTPWTSNQPVARPLPTHRTTQTQNKCTQRHPCLRVRFGPTIPAFEREKTVHALHRAATVIGIPSCRISTDYTLWTSEILRTSVLRISYYVRHLSKNYSSSVATHGTHNSACVPRTWSPWPLVEIDYSSTKPPKYDVTFLLPSNDFPFADTVNKDVTHIHVTTAVNSDSTWRVGVLSLGRVKNFFFSTSSRPVLGPTQPPIQWVPWAVFSGVKQSERDADHSPLPHTSSWRNA
jgi:hypothetical protein